MNILRSLLIVWLLLPGGAAAALPDPVTLGVAIENGDLDRARRWLDEGLDPNTAADRIGSGLMIAAWEGNIAMMELFAARGADLHQSNRHGEQALQLAAWRGHLEAVRWLLDHGARVNREGKAWSALHYAVFAGHKDVARLLMERGADVNGRAPNDASVLMMAAREGQEELAQVLIDAGADPRLANDRGDTALSWAMRQGNYRIAKLVSSAEGFAQAVRAPPESFGRAKKSVAAPSEITQLLKRLREAEAAGQPTEALRQQLMEAIARFKQGATALDAKGKRKPAKGAEKPALVITASRKGGERAEMVDRGAPTAAKPPAGATPAQQAWNYEEDRVTEFARLLEELHRAEAAGRPKAQLEPLRRAVSEALARMRGR
jgi:hypothetical protein